MFIFTEQNTIANHYIAELRDQVIQKDSMRFRKNMERLGELMAYEISKTLPYRQAEIETPLGIASTYLIEQQPVVATILRAGLPMYQGFVNFFDKAESSFIGAYRSKHKIDETFDIEMHYVVTPDLANKTLVLIDPMLATGKSIVKTYKALLRFGIPEQTHIVAAIASRDGINHVAEQLPLCRLWLGAVDEKLNIKSYIVPGLGDAGDLSYGAKL
jgi:uracil phosphoribosyltransferase